MGFSINKLRNILFKTNVVLGDVNAVQKGKIINRIKNKIIGKIAGSFLNKLFK